MLNSYDCLIVIVAHTMSKEAKAAGSEDEQPRYSFGERKLLIGCGIVATVVIGLSSLWMLKRSDGATGAVAVSTIRPTETIRFAPSPEPKTKAVPTAHPPVQPPQGTIKRMEAIQGAFSKK